MDDDRSYVERNTRERERLRRLVDRLDDKALASAVNESWTVGGVLGHMAFWDLRAGWLAAKVERGESFTAEDVEPDSDWINDSTRPLILAIPPREAARLAVSVAEETDARVAALPPERMWPTNPESPLNAIRAEHRAEHLDEIEAALRARG